MLISKDLNEFRSTNYFGIIKCFFKNKMIMNQTETVFLDFKRKEFPVTARNHYHKVFEAFKKKDKIDLMNLLSIPMFDVANIFIFFKNHQ